MRGDLITYREGEEGDGEENALNDDNKEKGTKREAEA